MLVKDLVEKVKKLFPKREKEMMETIRIIEKSSLGVNGEIEWNVVLIYNALKERFDELGKPKRYFTYTLEKMKKKTNLSEFLQRNAIHKLINAGLIYKEVREPKRRYFKLLF